jgi:hypothetical protein
MANVLPSVSIWQQAAAGKSGHEYSLENRHLRPRWQVANAELRPKLRRFWSRRALDWEREVGLERRILPACRQPEADVTQYSRAGQGK